MTFSDIERAMRKGVLFTECGCGQVLLMRATTNPKIRKSESGRQISWKAKDEKTGKIIDYLVTEGAEHYGPSIDIVGERAVKQEEE